MHKFHVPMEVVCGACSMRYLHFANIAFCSCIFQIFEVGPYDAPFSSTDTVTHFSGKKLTRCITTRTMGKLRWSRDSDSPYNDKDKLTRRRDSDTSHQHDQTLLFRSLHFFFFIPALFTLNYYYHYFYYYCLVSIAFC